MSGSTHIFIMLFIGGALLALVTGTYPLGFSRLLEAAFDEIEHHLASRAHRRAARTRRESRISQPSKAEAFAEVM